jgi:hypothetical protein
MALRCKHIRSGVSVAERLWYRNSRFPSSLRPGQSFPAAKLTKLPTAILYALLILVGFGVAVMVMRARRV